MPQLKTLHPPFHFQDTPGDTSEVTLGGIGKCHPSSVTFSLVAFVIYTAKPQVGGAVDFLDADQLLLFGPAKRPCELPIAELPLLLRRPSSSCRRTAEKQLLHCLLIDHAHHRSVRRNRQLGAVLC